MSHPIESEHTYYHMLEGSPFLFADERCKKRLLDAVVEVYRLRTWRLYAFCVTDNTAYFLSVTAGRPRIGEALQKVAEEFMRWSAGVDDIWLGASKEIKVRRIEGPESMEEVVRRCCQIHRIPLELGYVEQVQDYWWSSYPTYMGSFLWDVVDCHAVLRQFSADPELAKSRFRKFHRSFELPTLYITRPFTKNDAKIIKLNEKNLFLKKFETL